MVSQRRLGVVEDAVQRKIFGSKKEKVRGELRK